VVNDKPHWHKPDRENNATTNTDSQKGGPCVSTPSNAPLEHEEALQWGLWRILVQHAGGCGAKVTEVIDAAEERGIDPFLASEMLMFWLGRGDIRKATAPNRIIPQRGGWMP